MRTVAGGQWSEEAGGDVKTGWGPGPWRGAGRAWPAGGTVRAAAWKWGSMRLNGALKTR